MHTNTHSHTFHTIVHTVPHLFSLFDTSTREALPPRGQFSFLSNTELFLLSHGMLSLSVYAYVYVSMCMSMCMYV